MLNKTQHCNEYRVSEVRVLCAVDSVGPQRSKRAKLK